MGESIFNIVFNSRNMTKMAPVFIPATPIIMSDTDAESFIKVSRLELFVVPAERQE